MNRRFMLAAGSALCAVPLFGCKTPTSAATLAGDVQLVDAGAQALAGAILQIAGVPAATVAQVQGYLTKIDTAAAAVQAGTANNTTLVQDITGTLKVLVPIALTFLPGASPFIPVANAALSMIPALLAWVGLTGASGVVPVYSPDNARLLLRAIPAK